MLYYLPLEQYKERYEAWSRPITGWLERVWIEAGIKYKRINGNLELQKDRPIKLGVAVDSFRRCRYCFSQLDELIQLIEKGEITETDVIYFDDFWHPGIEALPYIFCQLKFQPKVFCFCHAQSVDQYDFTYSMKNWIRHYEKGLASWVTGIFVNCSTLKNLLIDNEVGNDSNIHVIGHVFNSNEVMERMPEHYQKTINEKWSSVPRKNQVVFSSRWDKEKNPLFYLSVGREVIKQIPNTKFVVCTGSPQLRSNDYRLLDELKAHIQTFPNNFELKEGLTKEEYYEELVNSKIQFSCSDQDFVSFVLLEGVVAGCYPVYPRFRSFPEVFSYNNDFMYERLQIESAVDKIIKILQGRYIWSRKDIESRSWIYKRHDYSSLRMLNRMGLVKIAGDNPYVYSKDG